MVDQFRSKIEGHERIGHRSYMSIADNPVTTEMNPY